MPSVDSTIAGLQEAVHRAITSREIARSASSLNLLRFLMELEQTELPNNISEAFIARRHFNRGEDFDPGLDSIVRVNITRLRAKLEAFAYANPSLGSVASLPPGEYRLKLIPNPFFRPTSEVSQRASEDVSPAYFPRPHTSSPPLGGHALAQEKRPVHRGWMPGLIGAITLGVLLLAVGAYFAWHRDIQQGLWGTVSVTSFSRAGGMEQFPTISPDGRTAVFAWNRSQEHPASLYTQAFGSTTPALLSGTQEGDSRPSFSPNGHSLAFVREHQTQGIKDIIVQDLGTGRDRVLTTLDGYAPWVCRLPKLSWSPDSRTIYTAAATLVQPGHPAAGGEQPCGIVRIDVGSGQVQWLTHAPATTLGDLEASVSPDGKQIAFLRREAYAHDRLMVIPADGGEPRPLDSGTFDSRGIAWSADGRFFFLCEVDKSGSSLIEELPIDGGPSTTLIEGLDSFGYPALSPDGKTLLVSLYSTREGILLYRNGQSTVLISDDNRNTNGTLSPDGNTLAFASQRTGLMTIWLQDIAGRTLRPITDSKTAGNWPEWNGDGSALLYECRREKYSQVCEYFPATSRSMVLTQGSFDHMLPSFSHDGKHFYYVAGPSGKNELYRNAFADNSAVQITHGGALSGHESVDGQSLYIITNQQGPGFLAVPISTPSVDTSPGSQDAQRFVLPQLPFLGQLHPWSPAPGGVMYTSFAGDHTDVFLFHTQTHRTTLVSRIAGPIPVEVFRLALDGTIVYSPQAQRQAGIEEITLRLQKN